MQNNSKIRLVLFDVGGVLIKWDDSLLYHKVAQKFGIDYVKLSKECEIEISRLHTGEISEEQFWKIIGNKVSSHQLMNVGRSLFYDIYKEEIGSNHEVLSLAKEIKKHGIKIGVLSNLESITTSVLNELKILNDFEIQFLSHKIGFAKPDKRIFQYVIRNIPFKINEFVFIDDKSTNVAAARSLGINAIQYSNFKKLQKDLNAIGVYENKTL